MSVLSMRPVYDGSRRRIPVFINHRLVRMCEESEVHRFLALPHAEIVRRRKDKKIMQINLRPDA